MNKICQRFFISGRVQGVWFRAWTQQQAEALRITGYARNLSDGRVEVLACGHQRDVAQLQQLLWQGPPLAQVSDVRMESLAYQDRIDFTTG